MLKYILICFAFTISVHAETYEGKNGKAAHNKNGTAVQTSNGTAVHARGSGQATTHKAGSGANTTTYRTGAQTTNQTVHTGSSTAVVRTNSNWNSTYWSNHQYGYWNGQKGHWSVVGEKHVFVVIE
jgi:hypothetical protein